MALQDRWPLLRGDNLVVFYYLNASEKVALKHQKSKSEKVTLLEVVSLEMYNLVVFYFLNASEIWPEPLLKDHMSYKAIFYLS